MPGWGRHKRPHLFWRRNDFLVAARRLEASRAEAGRGARGEQEEVHSFVHEDGEPDRSSLSHLSLRILLSSRSRAQSLAPARSKLLALVLRDTYASCYRRRHGACSQNVARARQNEAAEASRRECTLHVHDRLRVRRPKKLCLRRRRLLSRPIAVVDPGGESPPPPSHQRPRQPQRPGQHRQLVAPHGQ